MRGEKGTSTVSGYRSQGTQSLCFRAPATAERMVLTLAPSPEQNRAFTCRAAQKVFAFPIFQLHLLPAQPLTPSIVCQSNHDCLNGEFVLSQFS